MIYEAYKTLIGPNEMLKPKICKNTKNAINDGDRWNISVAKNAPIKLIMTIL
jgi:hypothetical protein